MMTAEIMSSEESNGEDDFVIRESVDSLCRDGADARIT